MAVLVVADEGSAIFVRVGSANANVSHAFSTHGPYCQISPYDVQYTSHRQRVTNVAKFHVGTIELGVFDIGIEEVDCLLISLITDLLQAVII